MFARNLVLSCWLLSAVVSCGSEERTTPADHGAPRGPGFLRGLNLGNRLDAPSEGAWGPVLHETDFPAIAARGFDHVRLPVRFNAYAETAEPYELDETFMQRVDWALDQALLSDLAVVLDFHHYTEIHQDPDGHEARFLAIWEQIANRYQALPETVAFELLNEPQAALDQRWNDLFPRALEIVRRTNPTRRVIVDSLFWAGFGYLSELEVSSDDPNLVATAHMYEPILFTHQGLEFAGPEFQTTGIVYPGPPKTPVVPVPAAQAESWVSDWFDHYNTLQGDLNPCSQAATKRVFMNATRFTALTGLSVYNGEWGAGERVDPESRVRWIRDVREESERLGIGWAYWDDGGAFQLFDAETGKWNEPLVGALFD